MAEAPIIDPAILQTEWPVDLHDTLDSTSAEAHRRAAEGLTGPRWFVAREQTQGRGRLGRNWTSPQGNLFATALLPLKTLGPDVPALALSVGLAVVDTIDLLSENRVQAGLKWPNDVRVDGAKICGILLESGRTASRDYWLSMGIGLNLAHSPDLPNYRTTNLAMETGFQIPVETAIEALDRSVRNRLKQQIHSGRAAIIDDWMAVTDQKGELCRATYQGKVIEGRFVGLDAFGQLMLKPADQETITITAGDVDLVRDQGNAARN